MSRAGPYCGRSRPPVAAYRARRMPAAAGAAYGDRVRPDERVRTWLGCHPALSSVLVAVLVLVASVTGGPGPDEEPLPDPSVAGWALVVLGCILLVLRLRWPVGVWVGTLATSTAATLLDGGLGRSVPAVLVAVYTVAAWRPWRTAIGTALASALVLGSAGMIASGIVLDDGVYALVGFGGTFCATGIAVRNQRAVVAAAQERARIAEQTREEEAQRRVTEERMRIARELHDVVAHHISVVNVQAGLARHLLPTDPAAADAALANVRDAAALVLRETGSILGLLRTTEDAAGTEPAPGADRLDALVAESRQAGLDVEWSQRGTSRPLAPAADLAAYRIAQEALTNARRHGTGRARLVVSWTDGGLVIEVRNPLPDNRSQAPASGGHGLVGMRERVTAAGGRLDVGASGGSFAVRAELPYAVPVGARAGGAR